jgi:hypothetical protein
MSDPLNPLCNPRRQDHADFLLMLWQHQRAAGIPPEQRKLPADDDFERDLDVIRAVMERRV